MVLSETSPRQPNTGFPMLPTKRTSEKSEASILAISDEVVLLPFVPVIPIVWSANRERKMFVAEVKLTPSLSACWISGSLREIPGDRMIVSYFGIAFK